MIVLRTYNLRDASEYFNYFEVGLWTLAAVVLAVHGLRREGPVRRDCPGTTGPAPTNVGVALHQRP